MAPVKTQSKGGILLVAGLGAIAPLAGISFFGWDWREILVFYWLGNITIGAQVVWSLLQQASSVSGMPGIGSVSLDTAEQPASRVSASWVKGFMVVFFIIHYGMFTLAHGVFVFTIISGVWSGAGSPVVVPLEFGQIFSFWIAASVAQLVAWRVVKSNPVTMPEAYGRLISLHLSIIFGVFLITALQWPAAATVLLVALSFMAEVAVGLKSKKPGSEPVPQSSV